MEKQHQKPRHGGMEDHVDDVISPDVGTKKLPLKRMCEQMDRRIVLDQYRNHARRVQDGDEIAASRLMDIHILFDVMPIIRNEIAVECRSIKEKGQA